MDNSFKLQQAIGSLSIEGIVLSESTKGVMADIIGGKSSIDDVRKSLLKKYKQLGGHDVRS